MIIERFRATIKRGRMAEALAIVSGIDSARRVGRTFCGDNDILSFDVEYADMAAFGAAMEHRFTPEAQGNSGAAGWWDVTAAMETELLHVAD